MYMKIDIADYISEEERKAICIDVFRDLAREAIKKDNERIFSNAAYDAVIKMVNESLGDDCEKIIHDKALKVIEKLDTYTVFKRPDAWDKGASLAFRYLENAVKDNREVLDAKVAELLSDIPPAMIKKAFGEAMQSVVTSRLFGEQEDEDDFGL